MSLDVYLAIERADPTAAPSAPRIFIREAGSTKEISREEWDTRYPGREPFTALVDDDPLGVYSGNITHNLSGMADEAGLYTPMWRPDECGITIAAQLIPLLETGLAKLEADPARFRLLNPANGWGNYEGLVDFTRDYLAACRKYPQATVRAWR
jgi:hypothetical protein